MFQRWRQRQQQRDRALMLILNNQQRIFAYIAYALERDNPKGQDRIATAIHDNINDGSERTEKLILEFIAALQNGEV